MNLTAIDDNIIRLTQAKKLLSVLESLHNTGYKSQYVMANDGKLLSFNLAYKSKYNLRLTPICDAEFGVKLNDVRHVITNKSDLKHVRDNNNQFDYDALLSLIRKFTRYVEWREYVTELLSTKCKGDWVEEVDRFVCKVKDKTFTVDARVYNFYTGDESHLKKFSYDCNHKKFAFADLIRDVNQAVEETSVATIRVNSVEQISVKLYHEEFADCTVHIVCSSLEVYSEVLKYLSERVCDKVILEYNNEKYVHANKD